MSKGIYQLVYASFATQNMDERSLTGLLERARNHNESHEITGALLYKSGVFIQLLEGSRDEVEVLYEKIVKDPRHKNVRILTETTYAEARLFSDCSMAFKYIDNQTQGFEKFGPWFDRAEKGLVDLDGQIGILKLLKDFRFKFGETKSAAS